MKKIILTLLVSILLIISCTKNGVTLQSPDTPKDSAKYILQTVEFYDPVLKTTVSLICYNADYSVKWKRDQLGTKGTGLNVNSPNDAFYSNGVVYISEDSLFGANGSFYTINKFYAIDINTGVDIWKKRDGNNYIQNGIIRNDTIFCNLQINGMNGANNIAAYNAVNGTLLWMQPLPEKFGANNLKLDGNILYFVCTQSDYSAILYAFDLSNKTTKWKIPIGVNFAGVYSKIIINKNILYIKNAAGMLLALDKNTGSSIWQKGPGYGSPMFENNLIYTFDNKNEFSALDPATGSEKLHWQFDFRLRGNPYFYGENMHIFSFDPLGNFFNASYSALTTNLNWKKIIFTICESPVISGDKIFNRTTNYGSPTGTKIMILDANSGAVKDSIVLTNAYSLGYTGIITNSGNLLYPNL
jgi:outer membrane protein assembly factor BamB